MNHMTPAYFDRFYCIGTQCPAPCAAPVDMTWTAALGDFCETGLSMACPNAAELILLHPEKTAFLTEKTDASAAPRLPQLLLMLDARRTMDLIVQNRQLAFRTDVVLSLIYGLEFDPMISTDSRYAYDELDWGFTEQPYRQIQAVVQLQGGWDQKRDDLCAILAQLIALCGGDTVLFNHLAETRRMFLNLTPQEYRDLRDRFDQAMAPREFLFENLLVYDIHRHFLSGAAQKTVLPGLRLMAVHFAAIRAMAARLFAETGAMTDDAFVSLCWHYARCMEENPETFRALAAKLETDPLYSRDRLLRLLWN